MTRMLTAMKDNQTLCQFSSVKISVLLQCSKTGDCNILNQSLNIKIKLILVLLKQKQRT